MELKDDNSALVSTAEKTYPEQRALLEQISKWLTNPSLYVMNLAHKNLQLNVICLKSRDENVKICINVSKYWVSGEDPEEDEIIENRPKYLSISWIDTSRPEDPGHLVKYEVGGKIVCTEQDIKESERDNWVSGDTILSAQVYDWQRYEPKNEDLQRITEILREAKIDSDFQEKVLSWPRQWFGEVGKKDQSDLIS